MIQLRTFGGLDLKDSAGRDLRPLLSQPKRLALLTYLVLANASGFCRRDKVIALFWPELDDEHARGSLRQALTFLRRALGDGVIVTRGEEEIGVDAGVLECDAAVFSASYAAERHREAMALYRGEFFDGFFVSDAAPEFQAWVDDQRAEFRRRASICAWSLAEGFRSAGDRANAASSARQAAALAPDDEGELARLIGFLDSLGDRAGAIAAYQDFAAKLKSEYDADPAPETQALIRSVRARTQAAPSAPGVVAAHPAETNGDSSGDGAPTDAGRKPRARRSWPLYLAVTTFVALTGYLVVATRQAGNADSAEPAVAVLPFRDLSRDPTRQYVADGLTDELITDLARNTALRVINTPTMLAYRDSGLAAPTIAARLHANVVVTGALQFLGDTVHQTVQLSAAHENRMLWARTFDGTRSDLLRMQLDVAHELARAMRGGRAGEEAERGRSAPQNSGAIDLYIRGRRLWSKPTYSNLLASIQLYSEALDSEPAFALAHSGIADSYVRLGYGSWLAPDDAFPKAEAAAKAALEIDSTLAEPHATLGFVDMYYHWDWQSADREFKRSFVLNPSYATAHEWYGLFLAAMGRFDEALSNESRAMSLDPLSTTIAGTTGWVQHYAGRQSDAERELKIALRMDSTFVVGHFYLGRVYQAQGMLDSALSQYAQSGPLRAWVPTIAAEGYVDGLLDRHRDALATLARMDSLSHRGSYVTAYAVALVHASLGNRDSTFAWLERGVRERTHWMVWLNRDPRWAPVRSDPRFAALVREVGLPP